MWLKWDSSRCCRIQCDSVFEGVHEWCFLPPGFRVNSGNSILLFSLGCGIWGDFFFSYGFLWFSKFLPPPHSILTVRENEAWAFCLYLLCQLGCFPL